MTYKQRIEVRNKYKSLWPIDEVVLSTKGSHLWTDPYLYGDWGSLLSKAEFGVWHDIRLFGLKFLPEFPAGKYFIDFADPIRKIAIEVQSKQWHSGADKLHFDIDRTKRLEDMGWFVMWIDARTTQNYESSYLLLHLVAETLRRLYGPSEQMARWMSELRFLENTCLTCSKPFIYDYRNEESPYYEFNDGYCQCTNGGVWAKDITRDNMYLYISNPSQIKEIRRRL